MHPPPAAPTHFAAAGRRHLDDGQELFRQGRHVTADHLAGLAAECGLKAILIDFLGATLSSRGIPQIQQGTGTFPLRHHLPELWGQVGAYATGRSGTQFIALLTATNPFASWDIADRYADGSGITQQSSKNHLTTAVSVTRIHEQARLNGSVS